MFVEPNAAAGGSGIAGALARDTVTMSSPALVALGSGVSTVATTRPMLCPRLQPAVTAERATSTRYVVMLGDV
jgi:hypothetical protein